MLRQVHPLLREGQLISIVIAGETRLFDCGRVLRISDDKLTIDVEIDSPKKMEVGFVFLLDQGQWRHFFRTDRGNWTPGIGLEPKKEVRYLIEGIN